MVDYGMSIQQGRQPVSSVSDDEDSSGSSTFSDENTDADALTINFDEIGMDSSRGDCASMKRRQNPEEKDRSMIGQKISNTSTFRWKMFVIVLMFINTAVVIAATSLYLNREADQEFQRAFDNAANTVSDASHYHAEALVNSLEVFSDVITSYSLDANVEWPYVTLPRWEERVGPIRESGIFDIVGFLPLVKTSQRTSWEAYAVQEQGWIQESYRTQLMSELGDEEQAETENYVNNYPNTSMPLDYSISDDISITVSGEYIPHPGQGPYAPIWQLSPPPPPSETTLINTDLMSGPKFRVLLESLVKGHSVSGFVISHVLPLSLYTNGANHNNPQIASSEQSKGVLFHPIRTSYGKHGDVKGFAMAVFDWEVFFSNLLPDDVNGVDCVLYNPCDDHSQTFRIMGRNATLIQSDDLYEGEHDSRYQTVLTEFTTHAYASEDESSRTTTCNYEIYVHPSPEFKLDMESNGPAIFTASIAAVFIGTGLIFLLYVYLIGNRQNKVMAIAMSTSQIVSSLFPSNVRDRIMKDAQAEVQRRLSERSEKDQPLRRSSHGRRLSMQRIQEERQVKEQRQRSKPIADLFPESTVLFADIVGFTAWSSLREPTQVFELLETIYHSFDQIARRRRVFKVETIGDCYVAVTGLPNPSRDHAVSLCRFARDCLHVMGILTKKLEVTLGPDTGELSMRFGLHSGPVTAGVLRGERSRFQLFGDTVNTAARMESHGERERIHISEQTAEKLREAGKEDWFSPREDKIVAKGKGELQTYWLHTKKSGHSVSDVSSDDSINLDDWLDLPTELFDSNRSKMGLGTNEIRQCLSEQNQRLADWNSNQLFLLLNKVVAHRIATRGNLDIESIDRDGDTLLGNAHIGVGDSGNILKEATDMIAMPHYDAEVFVEMKHTPAHLSELVQQQLHDYVAIICSMYVDNPFHSYQHASHVTMSVIKHLSTMAMPEEVAGSFKRKEGNPAREKAEGARLHSKTFAISSDPVTHFALAFAALIHEVDHPGVTNKQLVQENCRLARIFNNKCVAQQNSFQCAWDLLMDPCFDQLRAAIYTTKEELHHFRQLVVNAVIATDMMDQDLNEARNKRWEIAFQHETNPGPPAEACRASRKELHDRQAAVVLEYLMQASDVAHTMQHWHFYRKWNERLYYEHAKAYNAGRCEVDPSQSWYEAELEFFDNTVLPMARKLKSCGAFGVYFDESLNYAIQNRQEWERKGKEIVAEMDKAFEALGMGGFSGRHDSTEYGDLEDDPFKKQQ